LGRGKDVGGEKGEHCPPAEGKEEVELVGVRQEKNPGKRVSPERNQFGRIAKQL